MSQGNTREVSAFDVAARVQEAISPLMEGEQHYYYFFGGVAARALEDPATQYDTVSSRMFASEDLQLSNMRPVDHWWQRKPTKRDTDVGIMSTDPSLVKEAQRLAVTGAQDELVVSFFGLRKHAEFTHQSRIKRTAKEWLSHRTLDDDGTLRYVLYPVEQAVSTELFKPWTLTLPNGADIPVMHPVKQYYNYQMRSISGLRHKDAEKIARVEKNLTAVPEFQADMTDKVSPFEDCRHFIRKLRLLERALAYSEEGVRPLDLKIAQKKAAALQKFEASEFVVHMALHGPIQRLLNFAVDAEGEDAPEPVVRNTDERHLHLPFAA